MPTQAAPDFIPAEAPDFIPAEGEATPQVQSEPAQPQSFMGSYLSRLENNAKGLLKPWEHPIDSILSYSPTEAINNASHSGPIQDVTQNPNKKQGMANAAADLTTGLAVGGLTSAVMKAPEIARTARTMAIGDPDAAALQGIRVPAGSSKVLSMQRSVQAARPYLQGAQSLEDLQSRIQPAKDEIWSPYQETIDRAGDTPVHGPDGPTTIRELEQERLQLSALNRGLKMRDPEAQQLAQQKGLNQAQLLDRERSVISALDPALSKFGIDPKAIRGNFGAVSRVGGQISGKSTLLQPDQPYGFAKIPSLDIAKGVDLTRPSTYPSLIRGVFDTGRDIAAGRYWYDNPTNVGIREGFRMAAPKPNVGQFTPRPSIFPKMLEADVPGNADYGDDYSSGGFPKATPTITSPPPRMARLPASASEGNVQPMMGIRNDYPSLATKFAREPAASNFAVPKVPENGIFTVDQDGNIIPERKRLPAAQPKMSKRR